jgi:hypothetical protein
MSLEEGTAMAFKFNHQFQSLVVPAGPQDPEEDLGTFRKVLDALDHLAAQGETPEELYRLSKIVHCGATVITPTFEPGLIVFRSRPVLKKPIYKSEISYPPVTRTKLGRSNAAHEPIFYGSIGPNAGSTLYECRAKPGDLFAIGTWFTTVPLILNHMGFSNPEINNRVPGRPLDHLFTHDEPSRRNAILRSWQSDVFTRIVPAGNERFYNLSIALTKLGLETEGGQPDVPSGMGGILYPSVCTNLMTYNVALKPTFVDTGLKLSQIHLVRVRWIDQPADDRSVRPLNVAIDTIDTALSHRSDGRLIWLGESTWGSVTSFR